MAIVVAVLAGLGIEKGIELVYNGATKVFSRSVHFNSSIRDFAYGVDYLEQHIEPVDDQNRELNRTIQKARGLLNKCRNVRRWNIIKRHRYTTKLLALGKALRIHVRILELRHQKEILELSRKYGHKFVESANVENEILHLERYLAMVEQIGIRNDLVPSFNGGILGVPLINPKDDDITIKASSFHVGLDVPLRELKKKLLTDGVSMLVVTGIGGCGKTTLAKQFCQDDQVKGMYNMYIC